MDELDDPAMILSQVAACFGNVGVTWSLFDGPPKTIYDYRGTVIHYIPSEAENKLMIRENFEAACRQLLSQGIITPTPDGGHCVHASFHKDILTRMTLSVLESRYAWATSLIYNKTPQQKDGHSIILQWPNAQQWLPSMTSLLDQAAEEFQTMNSKTLFLLAECGRNWSVMLSEQGNYVDAEVIQRQAFMINNRLVFDARLRYEQQDRSVYPKTTVIDYSTLLLLHADLYSILGTISIEQNLGLLAISRMEKVRKLRTEALEIQTHGNLKYIELQKEHINMAVHNVAASYIIADKPRQALSLLNDLQQKFKEQFRPRWRGNQALSLFQLNRLQEANELIDMALASNASPWEMARFHFTKANILLHLPLPDIELAEEALNDCLALRLQIIPNHPLTGLTYHKLGKLYQDQKRLSEASVAFSKAVNLLRPACTECMANTATPTSTRNTSTPSFESTITTSALAIGENISRTSQFKTSLPVTFLIRSLWAYSRALYLQNRGQEAGKYQDEAYDLINSNAVLRPQ
ncbi:hypothetical protein ONS95_009124 [Cadophora gregata]|uniref:uncharacterized protein n=1 Tax=Cadophora gregata TaxID=51156 RepID=UPI0026DB9DF7|nr:uncharacterized protein ONS95_009124 [Cadophora gregata]KAK0124141.1 hypothetical protein ONS95_009124 [Cadophora gregata]